MTRKCGTCSRGPSFISSTSPRRVLRPRPRDRHLRISLNGFSSTLNVLYPRHLHPRGEIAAVSYGSHRIISSRDLCNLLPALIMFHYVHTLQPFTNDTSGIITLRCLFECITPLYAFWQHYTDIFVVLRFPAISPTPVIAFQNGNAYTPTYKTSCNN